MAPEPPGPFLALAPRCHLKRLEEPALYDAAGDRLYELDEEGLGFLASCPPVAAGAATAAARELVGFCRAEGLLAETAERRPVAVPDGPPLSPSLRYLLLHLTDRCTLRCRHCFIGQQTGADLPLADVLRTVDEFAALQGLRLIVSGGEPLLHRHFWRLNERLRSYPLRSILLTNGTMLDRESVAALRFDEVQVSLDGPEDAHDALRGRGSFRRAVGALRLLAAADVPLSVATVAFAGNLERFDELEAILKPFPLRGWSIDVPCPAGELLAHPELLPDPARAGALLARSFGGGFYGSSGGWACGAHLAAVMADGSVDKCGYFTGLRSGHVTRGLAEAWPRLPRWRSADLSCRCTHLDECRGGCRFRAAAHGSPLGPDPALCHLRGVPVGGDLGAPQDPGAARPKAIASGAGGTYTDCRGG